MINERKKKEKYNIYKIKIKAKPSNSVSKAQVICFKPSRVR